MKVTAILKDFTEVFYHGNGCNIVGFLNLSDADKFKKLDQLRGEHLGVTLKIGNGSFRDRVELNQLIRNPHSVEFKIEPRRGYKLATFTFNQ